MTLEPTKSIFFIISVFLFAFQASTADAAYGARQDRELALNYYYDYYQPWDDIYDFSEPGFWTEIKGVPRDDALLLGMWSIHIGTSGNLFGTGKYNEHNHLLGAQYKGFMIGTFKNSHRDRTYTAGISREIFSTDDNSPLKYDVGYNIGFLYGYGDRLPNVFGLSVKPQLIFGITWHKLGVDFGFVPLNILTMNFRINFG